MRTSLARSLAACALALSVGLPFLAHAKVTQTVTLNSVFIEANTVTVVYSKNFDTCVRLNIASKGKKIDDRKLFCQNAGALTYPRSDFDALLQVGTSVMLCKGGGEKICSAVVVVKQGNSLQASLAVTNPVGDTFPKGAQKVAFTSIDLKPMSGDITVQSLKIRRTGVGASSDFSGVYGVINGVRVTNKTVISVQNDIATLTFLKPLVVKAGTKATVQITGDIKAAATAGAEHSFYVELPTDIVSNATTVKGVFPLKGKTFRIGAVSSGVVSIAYRAVAPSTVPVGRTDLTIGAWDLSVNSTEDQTLYSMTIQNTGTGSDGDFSNIAIVRADGTALTKRAASTVNGYATLVFDPPFTILKGNLVTMRVIADINSGVGKKIRIRFDQASDVFSVGSLYGYGVSGQLYGSTVLLPVETSTLPTTVTITANVSPTFTVTGKSIASADTVVANQKNVLLQRFEGRALDGDILFTQAIFQAVQGSLVNAQNYALWVDTNNDGVVDTILQKGVAAQNGFITFSALAGGGYVVSSGTPVIFEVHADIASSLLSNTLQLKFATTQTGYMAAEVLSTGSPLTGIRTDGVCASTCQITVTTVSSTLYTLRSQGDLFITRSTTPVRERQLLGGTLGEEILRLQFHTEYEDVDVTNLVFTSSASGADASAFGSNVDRLELYTVGSTTPFAAATIGGCGSSPVPANSMCANMLTQQLVVQKGSNLSILVRPRMRTDTDGAVSGKHVRTKVDAVAGAKARGLLSSNNLAQNDNDTVSEGEVFIGVSSPAASQTIHGKDNVVVLSKITSITNADPNANGTAIPTGTQRAIGQFKFSTAAASNLLNGTNRATLDAILFNVNATNVLLGTGDQTSAATSDFKIYNRADPTLKAACTANRVTASGASLLVTCTGISSVIESRIDPGTDLTFVLQVDVINSKISNALSSTLQVSFQNFTDIQYAAFGPTASHIQWLDKDNGASTSFLWIEYPDTVINGTQYQS